MSPLDFFWIFLIIIALQPLFRQKVLEFSCRKSRGTGQHSHRRPLDP